jgi:hypothetical protein
MKVIPLTKGGVAVVDDGDFEWLSRNSWYLSQNGYAMRSSAKDGVRFCLPMHRAITDAPSGMHVDHINGDKLDNRRENLRVCTPAQNQGNRVAHAGRRFKGVIYQQKIAPKVRAEIRRDGRARHLGCFSTEEEAARAYDRAAREQWGEFARLNFPDEVQQSNAA